MRNGVIYTRVSYQDQVDGTSLQSQEQVCRQYCAEQDIRVVKVFVEPGKSAKTCDRPELHNMMSYCGKERNKIDVVIVYNLDRLSRNTDDHGYLKVTFAKYGVAVDSATEEVMDTPQGRLMATVIKGFSQFENEIRAEKSRINMVALIEEGFWCHKGPTGYLNSRNNAGRPILVENPQCGPLVRRAFELMGDNGYTQQAALDDVTARGLVGPTGRPLHFQTFNKMLRNSLYAGRIHGRLTGGRPIKARFKPLIDPDLFDRVQAVIADRGRKNKRQVRENASYPLRHWVKCGVCGRPLTASQSRGRRGKKYAYYHCYNGDCGHIRVPVATMHKQYQDLLQGVCDRTSPVMALLREIIMDTWKTRHSENTDAQQRIARHIEKLETRKKRLLDAYLDGSLDQDTFEDKKAELEAQICLSKCEKHDEQLDGLDIEAVLASAEHVLRDARCLWDRLSLPDKKRLNQLLFPAGIEYRPPEGIRTLGSNPAIELCARLADGSQRMAPPRGVEPLFSG